MKIKCYIFTWKGQFENAVKLENQLKGLVDVVVINSDDDNRLDHWVNIGNECYFSDQFRKALELFDSNEYDVLWHIQADASYDDWESIINSANSAHEKYHWGVYAPNVDDTFYVSERTDISNFNDPKLVLVGATDNTCWFIHKDFVDTMKANLNLMENNILGWGWDLLICAFSHINRRVVIRDYNYTINHPKSTGYKKDDAEQEMVDMFRKTEGKLHEVIYFMKVQPKTLINLYREDEPIQEESVLPNNIIVYDTEAVVRR